MASQQFDVFLCHNSKDKPAVEEIARQLIAKGLNPWLDKWHLRPGFRWQRELERQIANVHGVAVFVGESGLGPWQEVEQEAFIREFVEREQECPVIPVILPDCINVPKLPTFLRAMTWVDFREDPDDAFGKLLFGITGLNPAIPAKTTQPSNELQKQSFDSSLAEARSVLKQLMLEGAATTAIERARADVMAAKRAIREGNRLKQGDVLLDRYQVHECIGSGGFATVWKCFDERSDSLVAVKVLHPSHRDEGRKKERFFRGARLMKQLNHKNIVAVLEEECHDDYFHFYVMELVDGHDLRHAVLAGELSQQEVLEIICQSGDALAHAHSKIKDLIHRDIKPSNILLTRDKQAKVTDFDLVRAADTTGGTRTGSLGTFIYAAPETLQSANNVDVRADIFSLGMTALFGLHGRELGAEALRQTSMLIESLECDTGIKAALNKAVTWNLPDRYSTMHELVQSLRAAMRNAASTSIDSPSENENSNSNVSSEQEDQAATDSGPEVRQSIASLEGHSDWVRSVAVSHDGRRVVSGSDDDTVKVWDLESGRELASLEGHSDWVRSVAVSHDGRRVVSGSDDDTVKVWDLESGRELASLEGHSGTVLSVAVSPDGRRVVSGSVDSTVKVWDLESGRELASLEGHSGTVLSV
ncbi:MAG: protein kinase, partial [Planctomycetota bacterium]